MMEQTRNSVTRTTTALLFAGTIVLAACGGDGGTEPDHDDHGDEVEGVQLVMGGRTIASYDGDDGAWTGELVVAPGEESDEIQVRFVDHAGTAVVLDDDFYLEVEIEDESIAEFEQHTPGEFRGHLHGHAEGETEATFMLMHGAVGAGHPDLATAPVPVHVEP